MTEHASAGHSVSYCNIDRQWLTGDVHLGGALVALDELHDALPDPDVQIVGRPALVEAYVHLGPSQPLTAPGGMDRLPCLLMWERSASLSPATSMCA